MLTGYTQWKEELVVSDEQGRSFCFSCGWGVEPPVAYVPADWPGSVPDWLRDRRGEVLAVMESLGHVVREWP